MLSFDQKASLHGFKTDTSLASSEQPTNIADRNVKGHNYMTMEVQDWLSYTVV